MRVALLCLAALPCSVFGQSSIRGFAPESAFKQRALEAKLDSLTKRDNLRAWMKQMTAKPHHVGSAHGKSNAEFAKDLFKSWGFDARIETFDVLMPVPKARFLTVEGPMAYTAKLTEPPVEGEASSKILEDLLPPYNAYSPDGDVTAEVVYVNFGMPADYKILDAHGINVKGKIVLARYGGGWRGLKPKLAAERGAIGCLIYSDPKDDGFVQGDVYPKGGYRNENSAQRGSIGDMPVHPGDPLTPFEPSIPGTKRLSLKEAKTICRIPTLPISYADAFPILMNLEGEVVPADWRGGLPTTYHFGPGPGTAHLKLEFDWKTVECRNVIAVLKGSELPDQWVIRGNHHDAWVFGAEDPVSGAVALIEEARCVGELAKGGFRPRRTMVYCLWDGEEPGLLGSTEWVEKHFKELYDKAVTYVNTDSTSRGFFGMGGSHTLEPMVNEVIKEVRDPQMNLSVWERMRAQAIAGGDKSARTKSEFELGALGSGSDFTPFLQHAGVGSLNVGFGGETEANVYHSTYDSFEHYTRFEDTDFAYGETLAKVCGRIMLRMANADVLPFETSRTVQKVKAYVAEIESLLEAKREETSETNRQLEEGSLKASIDPKRHRALPKREDPAPYLSFANLKNAIASLDETAKAFDRHLANGLTKNKVDRERLDLSLLRFDRAMLDMAGLPGRTWYRHLLYAPGLYTGYGVKTLPGIREAVEEKQWSAFDGQAKSLQKSLEQMLAALGG